MHEILEGNKKTEGRVADARMFITVVTVLLQQGFQVFQAFFFTSQDANDENVFSSRICQVFVLAPSGHASYRVLFVACQSSCHIYIYIYYIYIY